MNTPNRQQVGKQAEQMAQHFLEKQGLRLVSRNYTCFSGEIDLIMRDKEDIVFIEVRSRSRTDYGHASETIDKHKQRKIIRTATHFLQKNGWLYKVSSRFDIVAIERNAGKCQMEWIKNAFWVDNA
jgi:putative endonuclease